ncbi:MULTISPECIES: NAD(P)H-dependent oxidoreductase [unclassified Pannonibacter]|uniref:NAD(P)H-dependent oxidoreductase n=1 Tax=unclassified Pannonibacter TaxID=2627228 RepID=UPI001643FF26|nr:MULTISPECIES: NAD(P)H-dependent oxidoreductase [unclassified Pannonibacter]
MRVLVLFAHPVEDSFSAALHALVLEGLQAAGHEVDDLDLYKEDFDPRLSREERLTYHDLDVNRQAVAPYVDRLLAAEALVIVHPVWNFGYPAILKGFFDRVFLPGVSFGLRNGKVVPILHNIRRLSVVTTYGGSRLRALLVGDPPRKVGTRVLRAVIKPGARVDYLALYDMNRADGAQRGGFLGRVRKVMEAYR